MTVRLRVSIRRSRNAFQKIYIIKRCPYFFSFGIFEVWNSHVREIESLLLLALLTYTVQKNVTQRSKAIMQTWSFNYNGQNTWKLGSICTLNVILLCSQFPHHYYLDTDILSKQLFEQLFSHISCNTDSLMTFSTLFTALSDRKCAYSLSVQPATCQY